MKKNVLVIGGSYFAGRVFAMHISKGDGFFLHVVNRGKYRLDLPSVKEYQCDRHDADELAKILPDIKYDAVVDFCGYNPGKINAVINNMEGRFRQYIFISTSSIYTTTGIKKEEDSILTISPTQVKGRERYLFNKVLLEQELKATCKKTKIPYTIVRPCFIYGPYNYAPRESYFIEKIVKGISVPAVQDSPAKFSMVYVLDVARALEMFVGNKKAFDETFNLAGAEQVTYASLLLELERCNNDALKKIPLTMSQVKADKLYLPFPLEMDDLCSGEKMNRLFNFEYTPFTKGIKKTFAAFKSVYS